MERPSSAPGRGSGWIWDGFKDSHLGRSCVGCPLTRCSWYLLSRQVEYEELCAAYAEEKAQLSLLTEKRALLLQEYSQIQEERRIRQEQKEQALQELTTMTRAAIRIQAFWRGYLVRSLLRPKRKKKKQGKGKKAKK